jgi:ribosome-associated protein
MTLKVRGEYITLGQLLKVAGLVGSGGEAKLLLADGGITINGEPEERRGRKLRPGDTIHLPDGQIVTLT